MKNSGKCIKCNNKRLWIVDEVKQPDFERDNCTWKMTVTSHSFRGADGSFGARRISPGSFQVIVCAECGYTEWYAYNFDGLKDVPGARLVGDDNSDCGPYR